jgi:hypothetical protein
MRHLFVLVLIVGCDTGETFVAAPDLSCPTARPAPTSSAGCVAGQWDFQIVTDAPPNYCVDPRCWPTPLPSLGQHCDYPGLACEYFGMTVGCDCNGVTVCLGAAGGNPGGRCASDGGA